MKVRLSITPTILLSLKEHWSSQRANKDIILIWADATLCFFGFFQSGEITVPTEKAFDSTMGDVAIDNAKNPQLLKVHQKKSKSDQLCKGMDILYTVHWKDQLPLMPFDCHHTTYGNLWF